MLNKYYFKEADLKYQAVEALTKTINVETKKSKKQDIHILSIQGNNT